MKLMSTTTTKDGRLTSGKIYTGTLVMKSPPMHINTSGYGNYPVGAELRVVVYDDKREWMTFDPKCFVPYGSQ